MAAQPAQQRWCFDKERLFSAQLEMQLVIVRDTALYPTGSAGNKANPERFH